MPSPNITGREVAQIQEGAVEAIGRTQYAYLGPRFAKQHEDVAAALAAICGAVETVDSDELFADLADWLNDRTEFSAAALRHCRRQARRAA